MSRVARVLVCLGVVVAQGLLLGTVTEAIQTPAAVDVDVDHVKHVVTITGRVTLYPLCAPRVRASPSFRGADGHQRPTSPCTIPEQVRQQIQDEMTQAGYQLDASHDFLPRQHFLIFK